MNKILLAITGSISAYKCIDLAKELAKDNEVKVLLTQSALNFINPQIFKYFEIEYYVDDFDKNGVLHIELARWASHFVVCPASASTIGKIANGISDNLVTTVALALKHDVVKLLVPAMNPDMYKNKAVQDNITKLKTQYDWIEIEPDIGIMACNEYGKGKLPKVACLKDIIPTYSSMNIHRTVLITAGATLEPIDAFRYITNPAKGGTAYLMALKALSLGYRVHVIKGKNSLKEFSFLLKNPRCTMETVISTNELLNAVKKQQESGKIYYYLSPMAVGDIHVKNSSEGKIKKKDMTSIEIGVNPDVLKYMVENKQSYQKIIGFAAESSLTKEIIEEKIKRKPVDMLVANLANSGLTGGKQMGFNKEDGHYWIIKNNDLSNIEKHPHLDKKELVNIIFAFIRNEEK